MPLLTLEPSGAFRASQSKSSMLISPIMFISPVIVKLDGQLDWFSSCLGDLESTLLGVFGWVMEA